jgi:uncharacterized protein
VIIVDTNVLVALADRRDQDYQRCTEWYDGSTAPLLVPSLVVAEACYLINKYLGVDAEALFLDSVGTEPGAAFQLVELLDRDIRRMAELVRKYPQLNLGGTDAAVVAIAERLNIIQIATMDHRHFNTVKPHHTKNFTLLP